MALQLRDLQFNSSFDSSFLKTPNTLSAIAQKVFGQTTEFRTSHELQEVLSQESHLLLQTQALLVIQRVMSRLDPDPHPFFLRRLLQYSKMWFQSSNQYRSSVDVVILILEVFRSRQWEGVILLVTANELIDYSRRHLLLDSLRSIKYSRWMKKEPPPNTSQLPFDSFMDVINYVSDLVFKLQSKHRDPDTLPDELSPWLVGFITDSIRMFTENDMEERSQEFKKWLSRYMQTPASAIKRVEYEELATLATLAH